MFKILIGLRFLFGVFFGGLEFSLTLVIGDEDACGLGTTYTVRV
jgi:hypothetical protein